MKQLLTRPVNKETQAHLTVSVRIPAEWVDSSFTPRAPYRFEPDAPQARIDVLRHAADVRMEGYHRTGVERIVRMDMDPGYRFELHMRYEADGA